MKPDNANHEQKTAAAMKTNMRNMNTGLGKLFSQSKTGWNTEPEEREVYRSEERLRVGAVDTESVKSGSGGLQSLHGECPDLTASRRDMGILLRK